MEKIKKMLHEGNHSLVIRTDIDEIFAFDGRGISDLLQLLHVSPDLLAGAVVADKVVGKAAAALMAEGGVRDVYAFTLSRQAVEMLDKRRIAWSCGEMVDHIVNRDGTGWCPMELCCRDCTTPQQCHAAIIKKIEEFKNKRQ